MTDCHCYACTAARVAADPDVERMFGQPVAMMRMFLCAKCGNKRCPGATDHNLVCSNSNEPGQRGSLYELVPSRSHSPGDGDVPSSTKASSGMNE